MTTMCRLALLPVLKFWTRISTPGRAQFPLYMLGGFVDLHLSMTHELQSSLRYVPQGIRHMARRVLGRKRTHSVGSRADRGVYISRQLQDANAYAYLPATG